MQSTRLHLDCLFISTLYSRFAEIHILTETYVPIWGTLCITEAIAIKAAMATKFKYIGGINDYFFGHFLFVANLGFAVGSVLGMYHLGSSQVEIMIFTGEWIETEPFTQIFWPVFVLVICLITGISGTVLTIKKNAEKKKDQRILDSICVNLDKKSDRVRKYNSIKLNQPILNTIEAFAYGLIGIGIIVLFTILEWMESNSFTWFYLAVCYIIKILWPCIGLLKTNDFNAFIRKTVNRFWDTIWAKIFRYVVSLSAKNRIHCLKVDQAVMSRPFEEKNTRPTYINFSAKPTGVYAIPTLHQSLLQMPPVEDTSAADIIFAVKANAMTMPAAYQTLSQFLQEMPTVEDVYADDALATDALVADTLNAESPAADALLADAPDADSPTTNALANTPSTDDSTNGETQKVTRPTHVFMCKVNGITMSPVYQTLAQFIKEMAPTEYTDDDILSKANAEIPVNVKGICSHVEKIQTNTRPIYINVMTKDNDITMPPAYPTVDQFIQEMPSLEDTDKDIQAEASNDTSTDVRGISRCVEETQQTYVFVAEINAITMAPTDPSVAQFIQEMLRIDDNIPNPTDEDASVRTLVNVIVHQEDKGDEAQQE